MPRNDHFVQAAYLGHWATDPDEGRDGDLYVYDKQAEEPSWDLQPIEEVASSGHSRPDFDQLSAEEAAELGVAANDLDQNHIGKIESSGILAVRKVIAEPGGAKIHETRYFVGLVKWVLLHYFRTPEGKERLADFVRQHCSEILGREVTETEFNDLFRSRGMIFYENYLLHLASSAGLFEPSGFNVNQMLSFHWKVRDFSSVGALLICSDNPVAVTGPNDELKTYFVPLSPTQLLIGHPELPTDTQVELEGDSAGSTEPRDLTRKVGKFNSVARQFATRYLFSKTPDPLFSDEELFRNQEDAP